MLKTGERAPEFTLPDDTGEDRSLTDFLNAGATVLYFYPADFTPGCTRQACALRDLQSEIKNAGLRVVGISPQSPETHAKFRSKYDLPFALLSDEDKEVIKMYGVNGPLGFGVRGAPRIWSTAAVVSATRYWRTSASAGISISCGKPSCFAQRLS